MYPFTSPFSKKLLIIELSDASLFISASEMLSDIFAGIVSATKISILFFPLFCVLISFVFTAALMVKLLLLIKATRSATGCQFASKTVNCMVPLGSVLMGTMPVKASAADTLRFVL